MLGGTGVRLGTRGLAKQVKRQVLKQEETKQYTRFLSSPNLTHSTIYTTRLNNLEQGVAGYQRLGDKVFYCGINLKFNVQAALANTLWRFYVVRHRDTFSGVNDTTFGSGITSSLMFRNGDTGPTAYVNSGQVNVVCAKTFKIDAKFTGEANITREFIMNCRMMQNFTYRTGSQEGEFNNYYLVILPWSNVAGSQTTGTTVCGNLQVNLQQVFKDA